MKTIIRILLPVLISGSAFAQSTLGEVKVTVNDERAEAMIGATVTIQTPAKLVGGQTSEKGDIMVRHLEPGKYDVKVSYLGYKDYVKKNVEVSAGKTAYVTFKMQPKLDTLGEVVVTDYYDPSPVDKMFTVEAHMNIEQIRANPAAPGDINAYVEMMCSSCSQTKDRQLVMRGSRPGASQMYVDGEKLYGSTQIPGLAIEQVSAVSGGIPAEYGDVTGGIVIITTQSYFSGLKNKQNMYLRAAEEAAAAKAAKEKAESKVKEENGTLIEENGNGGGQ